MRQEDLAIFDHLIYKRGTLLDKLLRRGSDIDYLCRHHHAQDLSHGINHSVISNTTDQKYAHSCSEGNNVNETSVHISLRYYE